MFRWNVPVLIKLGSLAAVSFLGILKAAGTVVEKCMGTVYAEITLKNAADIEDVDNGFIKAEDLRETTVRALVDTGAGTLVINEAVRQKLGLRVRALRRATFGNDKTEVCKVTSPVSVHWKDRNMACNALVASGEGEVLLGAIPLEGDLR
jgi:predicted aspartyl protease